MLVIDEAAHVWCGGIIGIFPVNLKELKNFLKIKQACFPSCEGSRRPKCIEIELLFAFPSLL